MLLCLGHRHREIIEEHTVCSHKQQHELLTHLEWNGILEGSTRQKPTEPEHIIEGENISE